MKKRKFTWVDILILSAVLLLVIGTIVKSFIRSNATAEPVGFSYTMEIPAASGSLVDSLQIGDTVYDNAGKAAIGVISDISSSADDEVTLTIDAEGTVMENGYRVGVYHITPEYCGTYFTKYAIWDGTVTQVN